VLCAENEPNKTLAQNDFLGGHGNSGKTLDKQDLDKKMKRWEKGEEEEVDRERAEEEYRHHEKECVGKRPLSDAGLVP
jgi:hypothetical protein